VDQLPVPEVLALGPGGKAAVALTHQPGPQLEALQELPVVHRLDEILKNVCVCGESGLEFLKNKLVNYSIIFFIGTVFVFCHLYGL
jgi:hypothetical protein